MHVKRLGLAGYGNLKFGLRESQKAPPNYANIGTELHVLKWSDPLEAYPREWDSSSKRLLKAGCLPQSPLKSEHD
jgi:hypothetical protein